MRTRKNTQLARWLAVEYERMVGEPFPGGPTNAYIQRTYAGRSQREAGAWSWELLPIDNRNADGSARPVGCFGSIYPAETAVSDPDKCIDIDWDGRGSRY